MATNKIENGCGSSIEEVLASNQKRRRVYAASSDNETFDDRAASLGSHQNIVTGIIQESEKLLCASEESATEPIL